MTSQYCAYPPPPPAHTPECIIRKQNASKVCVSYDNLLNVQMAAYMHSVTLNVKQGSITLQASLFHGKLLTRG